jgi:bacterial/archaeal transporter family-2 protein
MNTGLVLLVAAIGGTAVAVQGQFLGVMDRQVGTLASTFITYGGGGLVIGVVLLVAGGGQVSNWRSIPPFALGAGILGLVIIGSIAFSVARVGLVEALMTLTVAQFATAAVIDHFGILGADVRPVDTTKLAGLLLLIAGTWLALR